MDTQKAVNWLELPSHLLDLISDKLTYIKDFIRFGVVCHSWRSIYTQNRHRLPRHQLPVLMLHVGSRCCPPSHNFYDLSNKKILNSPSQAKVLGSWTYASEWEPHEQSICRGSSQGWLVYQLGSEVHLINPFLSVNNEFNLPNFKEEFGEYHMLNRPVLSADPASNSNYILLGSYIPDDELWITYALVFYKSGDNAWRAIPLEKGCSIEDIVYFRDQFYVLSWTQETRLTRVLVCDVSSCDHPHLKVLTVAPEDLTYIVESAGNLWGVSRIYGEDGFYEISLTVGFKVFKLDDDALRWVEMKSLGGRSLFVGVNASMSLLASEFPGCKPNCIYFTKDAYPRDIGVYNLEDGSIETDYPVWSRKLMADSCSWDEPESLKVVVDTPTWVEPTLSGCLM